MKIAIVGILLSLATALGAPPPLPGGGAFLQGPGEAPNPDRPAAPATPSDSRPGGIDLRLRAPRATLSIEGRWRYAPFDGSAPYPLVIRATPGGFFQFEGIREGRDRPVIQFDRDGTGPIYRGEVSEEFDPCVPAGARFSMRAGTEGLDLDPALPAGSELEPLQGACASARHFYLSARGRGDDVRLHGLSDLRGAAKSDAEIASGAAGRLTANATGSESPDPSAMSITIGTPVVPDGTEVIVLGATKDRLGKPWFHVRLMNGVVAEAPPVAKNKRAKTPAQAEDETAPIGPGESPKPKAVDSGYVSSESVVVRWQCRLERPGDREEGASHD